MSSQPSIPGLKPGQCGDLEGSVFLPPWTGYSAESDRRHGGVSDGHVKLWVACPTGAEKDAFVTPEQVAAYEYMIREADRIHDIILNGVFEYYYDSDEMKWFREGLKYAEQIYGPLNEDTEPILPDIDRPGQLKTLIELAAVSIREADAEGQVTLCYGFGCWDVENGLDVLMIRDEILVMGIDLDP